MKTTINRFWRTSAGFYLGIICLLVHSNILLSQGVTSATLTGVVVDELGDPLQSSHVLLTHLPTENSYGVVSYESGRFSIPRVKVGGPYTVRISYLGYEDYVVENIFFRLGQEYILRVEMEPSGLVLSTVEVVANKDKIFSEDRTGAATNVHEKSMENLPTIRRSLEDYIRLNPQASTQGRGVSFAGMNNRYNNFSIDGTVNNDVFGLSSTGTNGGQTGTEPISLDAIKELQIEVAPFDVRYGGFTGASINAVTRGGTNEVTGSAYYFVNNEKFAGRIPSEVAGPEKLPEYFERTAGMRLGAPLIKDKLFVFVNYEQSEREDPSIFNVGNGSAIDLDEAQRVENKLIELSGHDQGGFDPFINQIDFYKFFTRLDWNLSDEHKFTLRHNYVAARQFNLARRENLLQFNNTARNFPSTTNSTVMEVRSKFSDNHVNEFRMGYTSVRDEQNINGDPYSYIEILQRPNRIIAGSGRLFTADKLKQDIVTVTDHFTIFKDNHIITLGTHNEIFWLENLNITDNFGSYRYSGIRNFEAIGTPAERPPVLYRYNYSKVDGNPKFAPHFRALQTAFYIQDEFYQGDRLKLTAGIRAEIPVLFDKPTANEAFNLAFADFGVATDKLPDARVMISPRLGFNLDLTSNQVSRLRGGLGMFVSRVPFVWFSNQYQYTGVELASVRLIGSNIPRDFKFSSDPFNQPDADDLGLIETAEINITDPNFKYPKVFRINIGHDQQLPWWGLISSLDVIYSNRINDIDYKNLNLLPSDRNLEGADTRPYFSTDPLNPEYTRVLMLSNTKKGHAYNFTFQIQKPMQDGIEASVSYTYGNSKDVNSGASNSAGANWGFVEQVMGPNNIPLGISRYDFKSRINGYFQFSKSFIKNTRSSIGLFYNGQSGLGISFVYDGDLNNDSEVNDLIYIPRDETEISFAQDEDFTPEEQWEALDLFIRNDDYLSERRGTYAERNGKRMPFEHHIDLKLMQEFNLKIGPKVNRFLLTFDIFNLANLFNKEWGKVYASNQQRVELLSYNGGETQPNFYFNPTRFQSEGDLWTLQPTLGRWRGQFGLRYIFE